MNKSIIYLLILHMSEIEGFAGRIFSLRKSANKSQEEIGTVLGLTKSGVSSFEKGKSIPSPENLVKLARLFRVSVDYLLTGQNSLNEGEAPKNAATPNPSDMYSNLTQTDLAPTDAQEAATSVGKLKPGLQASGLRELASDFKKKDKPIHFTKRQEQIANGEPVDPLPPYLGFLVITKDSSGNPTYPVIDFAAAARYLAGFQTKSYFEGLNTVPVPHNLVNAEHQQGIYFQIEGDSMMPLFQHGDWVIAELLYHTEWEQIKDDDCCIVVSTTHGMQFKRVINRLDTPHSFMRCNSDNWEYPFISIRKADLCQIFRVVQHISSNFSKPSDGLFLSKQVERLEDAVGDLQMGYGQLVQQMAAMQGVAQPAHTPENAK